MPDKATDGTVKVKLPSKAQSFTITQIIEQAQQIFDFNISPTQDKNFYKAIRKRVERALEGKEITSESGERNRKYSRKDVYHLLKSELYLYFLRKSKEKNEIDSARKEGRLELQAEKYRQAQVKAQENYEISNETIQRYYATYAEELEKDQSFMDRLGYGQLTEEDRAVLLKNDILKKKKEIFFEFLFDNFFDLFFDFDEEAFIEDEENKLDWTDSKPSGGSILATNRSNKNQNYYELKISPDRLKKLIETIIGGE